MFQVPGVQGSMLRATELRRTRANINAKDSRARFKLYSKYITFKLYSKYGTFLFARNQITVAKLELFAILLHLALI